MDPRPKQSKDKNIMSASATQGGHKKPQGKNIMSAFATQSGHKEKEEEETGQKYNVRICYAGRS